MKETQQKDILHERSAEMGVAVEGQGENRHPYTGDPIGTGEFTADGKKIDVMTALQREGGAVEFANGKALHNAVQPEKETVEEPEEEVFYKISVEVSPEGSGIVSVGVAQPRSVKAGTKVVLTPVPGEGKKAGTITVKAGENTVDFDTESSSFTMPASDVTVNATFVDA